MARMLLWLEHRWLESSYDKANERTLLQQARYPQHKHRYSRAALVPSTQQNCTQAWEAVAEP